MKLTEPLRLLKRLLVFLGSQLSTRVVWDVESCIRYLVLGHWMSIHGFKTKNKVRNRDQVFDYLADKIRNNRVLYLEFGVFQGRVTRYWSSVLKNQESRLHGFDSFEGLPEAFDNLGFKHPKGKFFQSGSIPVIDDPRVSFFKGWFNKTLPSYVPPPPDSYDTLFVIIDADLYSSTIYVLKSIRDLIKPGCFIYFDDMSYPEHEAKAFHEFMDATGLKFSLICADFTMNCALFECTK